MKRMTLAAVALATTAAGAHAQDQTPVHSAEAVAAAILTGYVQRDVTLIAPHVNETNADYFANLLTSGEDVGEFFFGTRSEAGVNWDGMILPARYNASGNALVPFAIEGPGGPAALGSGMPGRYMSIVLTLDGPNDTTWGFEDINYTDRSAYDAIGTTR